MKKMKNTNMSHNLLSVLLQFILITVFIVSGTFTHTAEAKTEKSSTLTESSAEVTQANSGSASLTTFFAEKKAMIISSVSQFTPLQKLLLGFGTLFVLFVIVVFTIDFKPMNPSEYRVD